MATMPTPPPTEAPAAPAGRRPMGPYDSWLGGPTPEGGFIIDDTSPWSLTCGRCRHWYDERLEQGRLHQQRICAAFPLGIPTAIWEGDDPHTSPVRGDHGIQFEEISEEEITKIVGPPVPLDEDDDEEWDDEGEVDEGYPLTGTA